MIILQGSHARPGGRQVHVVAKEAGGLNQGGSQSPGGSPLIRSV